ncbi:MAG: type and secretion system protein [Verrucomicrobiales bacterium]|nr:type and secretion system protein [Verrucomicrobiales bacterium]
MNAEKTTKLSVETVEKPMKIKLSLILAVALAACGICHAAGTDAAKSKAAPAEGMKAVTNAPSEEIAAVIEFNSDTTLPQAVQTLARSAGINIQFDPALINQVKPDGTPMPPPVVNAVRWENITAKQALNALLENYNWRMVQDVSTGISRVTRKDTNSEPMVTTVVQLNYASPTNIAAAVTNTLSKTSRIIPDHRTSQIIVLTQEKELEGLIALIKKLDRATRQVLIEAKIIETTRNPRSVKGVNWTDTLSAQNVTFGNGITTGTVNSLQTTGSGTGAGSTTTPNAGHVLSGGGGGLSGGLTNVTSLVTQVGNGGLSLNTARGFSPATAFLNADGVHAVMSFLNSDSDTKNLALPRTVALDGVPTELSVVRNVPIFEQEQSQAAGSGSPLATAKPNYEKKVGNTIINEVGIKLNVVPRIVGMTNVMMSVAPEISVKEPQLETQVLGGFPNSAPVFSRRKITTDAVVPSGYTLVLGGLDNDNTANVSTKVPILGDIPGLGFLFRSSDKQRAKQNLLIFVTPTIVDDSDYQQTPSDFLKTRFAPMPEKDESAWDSAKPYDWTKPNNPDEPVRSPKAN